ncbi:nuclear transport factor 2 family protein [Actinomadura macrotermitis]|uniref:SnoaL-like domain-containing protein n=1 Tax=Actinomadura macrotermitis TaxID=2585200 RepID=A0A7K0BZN9_9ACTN|nr:nuclear transport factor 2 family protein [Actinomadura macrotermitis]MQY06639.1 hypothetical protein [Actinomadura macrotermitis]
MNAKQVVVRYVEAVANGDMDAIVDSFTPDVTWTYPGDLPLSGTWKGRDAVVGDFLAGATAGLFTEPPRIALVHVVAEGDQVVAEWTARGATTGGAVYDNRCCGIFTVRDGRIAAVREYTDTRHAGQALFGKG